VKKRYIDIYFESGDAEGLVEVDVNGSARIGAEWLKELLRDAGRDYEDYYV